jgi:glyoxylate/hydroxypyruvate reductase A
VALLPLTHDTRGLLARPLFTQLARNGRLGGPCLLNAGRGGLQVETDILACLHDGTLREAVLDVCATEPLPTDSPLWTHPSVTITPHNAAMSDPEAIGRLVVRQIARIEAGEAMEHSVTMARGY